MPSLTITPDISAEACEGAAGCARGSHEWMGIMPALAPKPKSASRKMIDASHAGGFAVRKVAKSRLPV